MSSDLAQAAERILFGRTLEDKLVSIPRVDRPGTPLTTVPDRPGRPPSLQFGPKRGFTFPSSDALQTDLARGRALHFFANHELLALELMALVLLRFPEAAPGFRRTLAATMADEQVHLSLYLERMRALGVALGEVPVNDYFWRTLRCIQSPVDFVAAMSLTFEQANLDFTRYYQEQFARAGDQTTADLLRRVYEDEIRHVRGGVRWLKDWSEGDLFTAYREHLPAPLTPARAKGPIFDRDARRRAGLPNSFVDRLAVFAHSKGRTPDLYAFDAACEDALDNGRSSYTPPENVRRLEADLAPLMGFLAGPDDEVLVPRIPSETHRLALVDAGFALPRFVTRPDGPYRAARFWGTSPRSEVWAEAVGLALPPTTAVDKAWSATAVESLRTSLQPLMGPADLASQVCDGERALEVAQAFFRRGVRRVVVKALLSASGRHRIFLDANQTPDAPTLGWLHKRRVRVDPWLERVRDLSLVVDGRQRNVLHMLTDERGTYLGHRFEHPLKGLDATSLLRRGDLFDALNQAADLVAAHVEGPFGIDAFIYRFEGELYLHPMIEANPRFTMGHVAVAIRRVLGRRGAWRHAATRPREAGLFTTDPAQAGQIFTFWQPAA